MRAIDLWALTADLGPQAALKAKIGDEMLTITGFAVDTEANQLQLHAQKEGQPQQLAAFLRLARQPAVRRFEVRVKELERTDAPTHIIFGCKFRDRAVVLH